MNTNFKKYLLDVINFYDDNYPTCRWGQVYLNALSNHQPNLTLKIVNEGKFDPFYNDKLIPKFLDYVQANWGIYD